MRGYVYTSACLSTRGYPLVLSRSCLVRSCVGPVWGIPPSPVQILVSHVLLRSCPGGRGVAPIQVQSWGRGHPLDKTSEYPWTGPGTGQGVPPSGQAMPWAVYLLRSRRRIFLFNVFNNLHWKEFFFEWPMQIIVTVNARSPVLMELHSTKGKPSRWTQIFKASFQVPRSWR